MSGSCSISFFAQPAMSLRSSAAKSLARCTSRSTTVICWALVSYSVPYERWVAMDGRASPTHTGSGSG
ncbi:hypothetical protein SVIOM74S_03186 [Streptomyces violarus]